MHMIFYMKNLKGWDHFGRCEDNIKIDLQEMECKIVE